MVPADFDFCDGVGDGNYGIYGCLGAVIDVAIADVAGQGLFFQVLLVFAHFAFIVVPGVHEGFKVEDVDAEHGGYNGCGAEADHGPPDFLLDLFYDQDNEGSQHPEMENVEGEEFGVEKLDVSAEEDRDAGAGNQEEGECRPGQVFHHDAVQLVFLETGGVDQGADDDDGGNGAEGRSGKGCYNLACHDGVLDGKGVDDKDKENDCGDEQVVDGAVDELALGGLLVGGGHPGETCQEEGWEDEGGAEDGCVDVDFVFVDVGTEKQA